MPHITLEYSSNIESALAPSDLIRKLHDNVAAHDIAAYKIKSRAIMLDDYIIGDEETETSMAHVTCLLLEGRPVEFGHGLSKDMFKILKDHIEQQNIEKCAASLEVREMNKDNYCK